MSQDKTKPTLADVLIRYRDSVVVHHKSCRNVTYGINAMLRDHQWLTDVRMKRVSAADAAKWRDLRMLMRYTHLQVDDIVSKLHAHAA